MDAPCAFDGFRKTLDNLQAEIEFVAEENPSAAARLASQLLEAPDGLGEFPGIGRAGRVPGTREFVIPGAPYILPCRVRTGVVEMLAWVSRCAPVARAVRKKML